MLRRATLLTGLLLALPAAAQEAWPSRPITILGGFPNGAGTDIYARKLAEPLTRALGQPVVVDNRTGAGGNIASEAVAKARPDGYLFLIGTAGTHAINATLYRTPALRPAAGRDAYRPAGRRAERAAGEPGEAPAIPELRRPDGGGAGAAGGAELCLDRQRRLDPPGRGAVRRRRRARR